uniref:Peptidase S1 domain-containing protein n=1 Tax=Oreochromis niloticus TaxID=8128 RepID=A0A669DAR0_ORENI
MRTFSVLILHSFLIEAKPHSRPYMASLQYQEHHSCGGMLIREDFVLTAGDSGGPLICNKRPQGVTAFIMKDNCNNPKYPHVFTKVNFFIAWMKEKMKEERFVARVTTQSFTG